VNPVGFIIRNITMHGHMNVKFRSNIYCLYRLPVYTLLKASSDNDCFSSRRLLFTL